MKFIYLIIIFLSTTFSFAGNIEELTINSKILSEERKLLIYLPDEYENNLEQKFDVVYVFDAQNRSYFDVVHSTINIQNYGLAPMIVVGIISENRNIDFLPVNEHRETKEQLMMTGFGNANSFKRFLKEELFVKIEKDYRALPRKIGIGHSNGATFLNYALLEEPDLFNAYFSIDANFGYDQEQLIGKLQNKTFTSIDKDIYYYACAANNNQSWLEAANNFTALLQNKVPQNFIIEKEFLKEESHQTVFQQGVINAYKKYLRSRYFNVDHLIAYYKDLENNKIYYLKSAEIEAKAKIFLSNGFKEQAKKIVVAFKSKLDKEKAKNSVDLLGLFGTGDLYLQLDFFEDAKFYFDIVEAKLEQFKSQMTNEQYEFGKKKLEEKQNELEQKK